MNLPSRRIPMDPAAPTPHPPPSTPPAAAAVAPPAAAPALPPGRRAGEAQSDDTAARSRLSSSASSGLAPHASANDGTASSVGAGVSTTMILEVFDVLLDESMFGWRHTTSKCGGLPHIAQHVPRMPVPIGICIRDATTEKRKQITEKGKRVALAVGVSPSPKKRSRA